MSSTRDRPDLEWVRARVNASTGYIENIDDIRRIEFPHLTDTSYLDHAAATPYASSLIDSYARDLGSNFFGNPHSVSASSQFTTKRVDEVRLQVLRYFNADPDEFDVVFVANATAGIKLVAEVLQDQQAGFSYVYHEDAHTSLVGVRELAQRGSTCMTTSEVETWFHTLNESDVLADHPALFAYAGQSNMTGQRYPLDWCRRLRVIGKKTGAWLYTLYDAAALLSTSSLDLSQPDSAPDFTVLSFYKIFGFPDLGALVVRKAAGSVFQHRRYFGGGTVDLVLVGDMPWHAKKSQLHSSLEDGTLPFHTIVALDHAMKIHRKIFGSLEAISRHTRHLLCQAYSQLQSLHHDNGAPICKIYSIDPSSCADFGPVIAFNLQDRYGKWVSNLEVEKLSIVNGFQLRTGGLCNPGGIAKHLNLTTETMKKNYAAGQRCGGGVDILDGAPTGSIRISFGASSSLKDIESFIGFLREFFTEKFVSQGDERSQQQTGRHSPARNSHFTVASISIFPIKSCGAFAISPTMEWEVLPKGLKWDREWCLIHQGTNIALSQKQYPRMALLHPRIDSENRQLVIRFDVRDTESREVQIDLDEYPETEGLMQTCTMNGMKQANSTVCGQNVLVHLYTSRTVSDFFSDALGVSCTLARFPQDGLQRRVDIRRPDLSVSTPESSPERGHAIRNPAINLSNESPILLISQSSVDELNRQIDAKWAANVDKRPVAGRQRRALITPESFRGNIVISEGHQSQNADDQPSSFDTRPSRRQSKIEVPDSAPPQMSKNDVRRLEVTNRENSGRCDSPYLEETFKSIRIRNFVLDALGPCQRCQMVCVDQSSGTRSSEPFSTLAKTRRRGGRVWFGMHMCLVDSVSATSKLTDSAWSSERATSPSGDVADSRCTPASTSKRGVKLDSGSGSEPVLGWARKSVGVKNEAEKTKQRTERYFIRVGDPIEVEM